MSFSSAIGQFFKLGIVAVLACSRPTFAWAADDDDSDKEGDSDESDDERQEGWSPGIVIGGTFSFNHTTDVIGAPDGLTLALGGVLDGSLDFNHRIHEWRNYLSAEAGVTYTPELGAFEKDTDELALESLYLLHLLENFGPYSRFALYTSMFPYIDLEPDLVTYSIANRDGMTTTESGRRLALNSALQPITFRESIGAFVQPVSEEQIEVELKAGVAAEQIVASGLTIDDDESTSVIEVKELGDSALVGAEVIADAEGFVDKTKLVAVNASVSALFPFWTTPLPVGDDRSLIELTAVEFDLDLTARLLDWASLSYAFGVLREPLIADQWQVTNTVYLSIAGVFGSKARVPPARGAAVASSRWR